MSIESEVAKAALYDLRRLAFWVRLARKYWDGDEVIDLSHADLRDVDLRGIDLTAVDLSYTDLSGANLSYSCLAGANLTSANLKGATLIGADLSCAWLKDADLSHTTLYLANLTGALLTGTRTLKILGHFWEIVIYPTDLEIGCERHTVEAWESFSTVEIEAMDRRARRWWWEWKDVILAMATKIQNPGEWNNDPTNRG